MKEFLIVGHGLAGSVIAHKLTALGYKVTVFDNQLPHSASNVSVGLVNPLIGPKLNAPEKIIPCLSENNNFFSSLEKIWGDKFYKPISLHRVFKSETQRKLWIKKTKDLETCDYTGNLSNSNFWREKNIFAPHGSGLTNNGYQLDVKRFLNASKDILQSSDSWESNSFTYNNRSKNQIIIFCEGFRVIENDLFKNLPFAPARGEVIKIQSYLKEALNNGSWHLPIEDQMAFIGSNWDHSNFICGPTERGKSEIFENCSFYDFRDNKIVKHLSGVRSGTRDRNPIIGEHHNEKNCFIFNGFGSRGTTTIPYYASKLIESLTNQKPIPKEVNLTRFAELN